MLLFSERKYNDITKKRKDRKRNKILEPQRERERETRSRETLNAPERKGGEKKIDSLADYCTVSFANYFPRQETLAINDRVER